MKKILFLCFISLACSGFAQRVVLDRSFGDSGIVASKVKSNVQKIVSIPDGKVLCLGTYPNYKGVDQPVLFKFDGNGELDSTFSEDGILQDTIEKVKGYPSAYPPYNFMSAQSDGRIYVAGSIQGSSFFNTIISCYDSNGNPILSFGKTGVLKLDTVDYVFRGFLRAFSSCPDNKIIVCWNGYYTKDGISVATIFAKFDSTGTLDQSFGTDGYLIIKYSNTKINVNAITVFRDGSIICLGSDNNEFNNGVMNVRTAIIKLNSNGTFNNNFGIGGKAIIDVDTSYHRNPIFLAYEETARNIIELDDHRMIVSTATDKNMGDYLIRLMPDGSLDKTFGNNGITKLITHINDLAIREDGSIFTIVENRFQAFTPNGVPETTMNLECPFTVTCVNMLNIDTFLLGGFIYSTNTTDYYSIAKYSIGPTLPVNVTNGEAKSVSIFPTSFINTLTFRSDHSLIQKITMYDLNGSCVLSRSIGETSYTLNMNLAPGMYLCKIATSRGVEYHKLVSTKGLN